MFSGWENRGKIVLSHLSLGGTEGHKSNEIVFVGSGGTSEVVRMKVVLSWFEVRESTVFELKPMF